MIFIAGGPLQGGPGEIVDFVPP